jgi:hypothetical protein
MKTTRLDLAISQKLEAWDNEATISAARAIQQGHTAQLVTYPSGMQAMRFAEPFTTYGMHFEVSPSVWESLVATGGRIYT